ncbi:MAG: class I SAM-dependent methyltransferase, partial [Candidatus Cloacimonadia bacterium]
MEGCIGLQGKAKSSALHYKEERQNHWNSLAGKMDSWKSLGGYYHKRISEIYQFLIVPDQRILEVGCGKGDLLASLEPSVGVGIDFSVEMISRARQKYPDLRFICCDAHELDLDEKFDVIILSDLVNDLWDVQTVFQQIQKLCTPQTRIILNLYSQVWELPLKCAQHLQLASPILAQNWLTVEDITNMMHLAGFEVIRHWSE